MSISALPKFLSAQGQNRRAAKAATEAGYAKAYNVTRGFEGDKDADRHRGTVGGWKVDGLPWAQK